jgi:hypothetical protein
MASAPMRAGTRWRTAASSHASLLGLAILYSLGSSVSNKRVALVGRAGALKVA